MKNRVGPALAWISAAAVVLGTTPTAGADAPSSASATIVVQFETPAGVPGLATLADTGGDAYATKAADGTTASVALPVRNGTHAVSVRPVMVGSLRYVGVASNQQIQVMPGGTSTVTIAYHLSEGVQDVHATAVTDNSIDLAWEVGSGHVRVRRTAGEAPATSPSQGTAVKVSGEGLSDTGLTPGTRYNYSFWTDPGDSAHGVDQSAGPYVLSVGTADPSAAAVASYVAKPDTFFAENSDIVSVQPTTAGGARVVLSEGVEPPTPGAAVVLPISETLRGGMLSLVDHVSFDGHTLDLVPGGMGDAFDYYHLSVDDFSKLPITSFDEPGDDQGAAPQALAPTSSAGPRAPLASPEDAEAAARAKRDAAQTASPQALGKTAVTPLATEPPTTGSLVCPASGSAGGKYLDFTPTFTAAGHFDLDVTKHGFLGVDIPTGVSLDAEAAVTASGAIAAKFSASVNCQIKLPSLMMPIAATPVPISFYLRPSVRAGVEGAISVSNLGVAVTSGFQVSGHIGLDGDNSILGSPIFEAEPLTPQLDAVSGGLFLKLSGTMLVGPGAGTSAAGAIAGVGGELTLLDGHANVIVPTVPGGHPCVTLSASYGINALVSARVWLSVVDFKADLPFLDSGVQSYPGFPWYWPDKCDEMPNPSDDLLGDGVTKVDDDVTGSPDQWGYLDGFVPGTKAWVLSTGLAGNAQGSPGSFASTDLGLPGDTQLSSYSGHPTYDAGSYTAMLIPSGTTLHVRYAFASEEYPEYVGSVYNDVMAVFVDGQNCAFVPGTTTPVSINSINDHTNEQYYVDNSSGASGYNAVFDGITVPLECSVPVTPGKPVTVRIALADASDGAFDSAVALLDGGIWSD